MVKSYFRKIINRNERGRENSYCITNLIVYTFNITQYSNMKNSINNIKECVYRFVYVFVELNQVYLHISLYNCREYTPSKHVIKQC